MCKHGTAVPLPVKFCERAQSYEMMAGICRPIGCTHVADVTMETFYVQNHEYKKVRGHNQTLQQNSH
jgi:hypothetical protein